jgi:DHA1 family tetracycline resistance protein-like MFS transporter
MNKPLVVIFAAIALDAVGIGLIFPILPRLLESVAHTQNTAPIIGIMIALYAVMQFIFAPVLGALSDNLGRRPVLLISLVGAAIITSPWPSRRSFGWCCSAAPLLA